MCIGKLDAATNAAPAEARVGEGEDIGADPTVAQLRSVVLSPANKFVTNELVLVPRSSGGFTIGRVLTETSLQRKSQDGEQKAILGYTVLVADTSQGTKTKDIPAISLGKIHQAKKRVAPKPGAHVQQHIGKPSHSRTAAKSQLTRPKAETGRTSGSTPSQNNRVKQAQKLGEAFSQFMAPKPSSEQSNTSCKIVLDGPNVSRRHGNGSFSSKGLVLAIEFWLSRGHEVVAFIPESYIARKSREGETTMGDFISVADDVSLLSPYLEKGNIVTTPPQDYDDLYIIEYARRHNGIVVSNDRYWDVADRYTGADRSAFVQFIRSHTMSFTWVKDEFLPNPDFRFPKST